MKVLYVVSGQSYKSPRPSRKIDALVNSWEGQGHEVCLICGGDIDRNSDIQTDTKKAKKATKIPWYRKLWILQPIVNSISEVKNIRHDKKLSDIVRKKIKEFKPDVFMLRSSRLDGETMKVAKELGIPVILEWIDPTVGSKGATRAMGRDEFYGFSLFKSKVRSVEQWKELNADFIIVTSNVLKKRLSVELGIPESKFYVAYNAVNIEDFKVIPNDQKNALRENLGLETDTFIATFVGKFAWYQGVELLVEAINCNTSNVPMIALMVGDGPGKKKVVERAQELGVQDKVIFVGSVPHEMVPQYLAASDAAILPDGTDIICPIKVMEYMAMGLPVLVPNYECNREVIKEGVTGYLFEPKNPDSIKDKFLQIYDNREKSIEIAKSARIAAEKEFNWDVTFGKALHQIETIISGKPEKKTLIVGGSYTIIDGKNYVNQRWLKMVEIFADNIKKPLFALTYVKDGDKHQFASAFKYDVIPVSSPVKQPWKRNNPLVNFELDWHNQILDNVDYAYFRYPSCYWNGYHLHKLALKRGVRTFSSVHGDWSDVYWQSSLSRTGIKKIGFKYLSQIAHKKMQEVAVKSEVLFCVGPSLKEIYGGNAKHSVSFANYLHSKGDVITENINNGKAISEILFVGTLSERKGIHILLEALSQLKNDGVLLNLNIVGQGEGEVRFKSLAEKLGVAKSIKWHGYVSFGKGLLDIYKSSDLFVLPSISGEGMPKVIVEAMSQGLPVVATNTGSTKMIMAESQAGILVEPNRSNELALAIKQIIENEQERSSYTKNGLKYALRNTNESQRLIVSNMFSKHLSFVMSEQPEN